MLSDIEIRSSAGVYVVRFAELQSHDLTREGRFLVTDSFFKSDSRFDSQATVWIDAIETNKSLTNVERVICEFRDQGVSRSSHILAIGGGIVQDIATLAASLYMRGVAWAYAPSTLLGMVDSCIGGKSSINTYTTKNLIGNIYPPQEVLIDTRFADSLPCREVHSGLAEALKIAFCGGEASFYEMVELLDSFKDDNLSQIIHLSLTTKKRFIEIDEFDKAERLQLNFGHTFGHAIEVATDYRVPHGLAVAIGMACASRFVATQGEFPSHIKVLEDASLRLAKRGLEKETNISFSRERFISAFRSDKKHPPGSFRLVLPGARPGVFLTTLNNTPSLEEDLSDCAFTVMTEVLK
jgi:3-dehydroquinate synthase